MSGTVDDSDLLSDSDGGGARPSGATPQSEEQIKLLSQQRGEDLIDSDDDDIFLGDIGIDVEGDNDLFGGAADEEVFAGMKRGRGTRLLTVGSGKGGDVKEVGRKKSNNNAWTRPVRLSASLASFLGVEATPRTDVTKKVWAYIKEHNLQNPANKREILCDNKLQSVLGVTKVNMFSMTKILSKHMFKDDEVDYLVGDEEFSAAKRIKVGPAVKIEMDEWNSSDKKTKKDVALEGKKGSRGIREAIDRVNLVNKGASQIAKERKKKAEKEAKQAARKAERKAKRDAGLLPKRNQDNNPFMKPLTLSPALGALLGETSMARPTVVKKMWERIKERGLQNPADKREIICDEEMRACFGVDKFTMFSMNKYLKAHLSSADGVDGNEEEEEEVKKNVRVSGIDAKKEEELSGEDEVTLGEEEEEEEEADL